jgi:hypothetical protein
MPNQQLIDYIRRNLQLGYTEEQLREVLITAGYDVRTIDDTIDLILRPQETLPPAPQPESKQPKQKKGLASFLQNTPTWIFISGGAGLFLLIVIVLLLIPTGGESSEALFSQNGLKIPGYDFNCAGPASSLTITVKNEVGEVIGDVQLFVDEVFQPGQLLTELDDGASATYTYSGIDCIDWRGERQIKLLSNKATAEGPLTFKCSSGACSS